MKKKTLLTVTREELPRGKVLCRTLSRDTKQRYYLYLPRGDYNKTSLFVSIHGVKRMAKQHLEAFAQYAERYHVALLAPLFSEDRFCDYQRLGHSKKSLRSDDAFHTILEEVSLLTSVDTSRLLMFGYSGGGQFVHRYAMAYPEKVQRLVAAASGWYTFPDLRQKYPYGIANQTFDPAKFLKVPSCVIVGERDIHRDDQLRKGKKIDTLQGRNRLERGKNWIQAMKEFAITYNLDTEFMFKGIPGCNHSFSRCMCRGEMGEVVFEFLFGNMVST